MKAFIDQLPRELEEAAAIDGAGLAQTLWTVVLPLSHAGLIATSVFIMVFALLAQKHLIAGLAAGAMKG